MTELIETSPHHVTIWHFAFTLMGRLRRSRTHHAKRDVHRATRTRVGNHHECINLFVLIGNPGSQARSWPNPTNWSWSQSAYPYLPTKRFQTCTYNYFISRIELPLKHNLWTMKSLAWHNITVSNVQSQLLVSKIVPSYSLRLQILRNR